MRNSDEKQRESALGKKMRYHKVLLPDGGVKAII